MLLGKKNKRKGEIASILRMSVLISNQSTKKKEIYGREAQNCLICKICSELLTIKIEKKKEKKTEFAEVGVFMIEFV